MENKINLVEILKDCPKGMELDCTIFNGEVCFEGFDHNNSAYPLKISVNLVNIEHLDIYGQYNTRDYAKCIIFPKGKTTWEGFVPPCKFKDGDIIYIKDKYNQEWCSILSNYVDNKLYTYIDFYINYSTLYYNKPNILCEHKYIIEYRLAAKEEKEKLFKAIKDNGYKWNAETKTLEKLSKSYEEETTNKAIFDCNVQCCDIMNDIIKEETKNKAEFKVGDRIRHKINIKQINVITEIKDTHYILDGELGLPFISQDKYELVPDTYELAPDKFDINTLKPFDKVLVRDNNAHKWTINFFGFINEYKRLPFVCVGDCVTQCIPYEGNEHLLGKTDDCDKYFKTWK